MYLAADLVQDLYLKELKSYKPAPVKSSDADAHVRKFAIPNAPPPPEESDIAKDLKAYEETPVEVEGALGPGEAPVDRFQQFLDDELKFYEQGRLKYTSYCSLLVFSIRITG